MFGRLQISELLRTPRQSVVVQRNVKAERQVIVRPKYCKNQVTRIKSIFGALGCIFYEVICDEKAFNEEWKIYEASEMNTTPKISLSSVSSFFNTHLSACLDELLAIDWLLRPSASPLMRYSVPIANCCIPQSHANLIMSALSFLLIVGNRIHCWRHLKRKCITIFSFLDSIAKMPIKKRL